MGTGKKSTGKQLAFSQKQIFLLLALLAILSLSVAYASYRGWWANNRRDEVSNQVEQGEKESSSEELLAPYHESEDSEAEVVQEEMTDVRQKTSEIDIESILSVSEGISQDTIADGERTDAGAQDDFEQAKEDVDKLIGEKEAVYYIRDNFYPLEKVDDFAYYNLLADLSFIFDPQTGALQAICPGQTSEVSEAFCRT